ncbi:BLUF domain-containing protein [Comamonas sp. 4034]|uniref:BLUF domain-containing protein n=1 Tax=Comamonas sp. 4034 TaxID=3156455 RepID=UPI003D1CC66E
MSPPLHCLLYISQIAPDLDVHQVGQIVKQARELNAIQGITGILVFDGERFAQYVEGPAEAISSLATKLAVDARHRHFNPLLTQELAGKRRFASWAMGYSDVDMDALDIEALSSMEAGRALEYFCAATTAIDSL